MDDDWRWRFKALDVPGRPPEPPATPPAPPSEPPPPEPPDDPLSGIPPEVVALFERLALAIAARGWERYSVRAILHRIRWHYQIEKGRRDFKCNNNWTPRMSRWFLKKHPELPHFFETRASPGTVPLSEDDEDDE